jgi:WD40 repeat protein
MLFELHGHQNWIKDLQLWGKDYLVSFSEDKTIRFWDLKTRSMVKSLSDTSWKPITSITCKYGMLIFATSDGRLILYN